MSEGPVTLNRFLLGEAAASGENGPELVELLGQLAFVAKVIAREMRRAALVGRLGLTGEKNPSGDAQKKMDVYANRVVLDAFAETRLVAAVASEELDELKAVECGGDARYLLCADPIDGSSNTDVNSAVGTIFAFFRRTRPGSCRDIAGELLKDAVIEVSGYVMYGPSTLLVYTSGNGVNGFTLDHDLGEFLLSHSQMRCPPSGSIYSANVGHLHEWPAPVRRWVEHITAPDPDSGRPYSLRYSGALVADLHRTLVEGGVYLYPSDSSHPHGKLRLLYECAPLAYLAEEAGASASTGERRILDLERTALHQTAPLVIGSSHEVETYQRFVTAGSG